VDLHLLLLLLIMAITKPLDAVRETAAGSACALSLLEGIAHSATASAAASAITKLPSATTTTTTTSSIPTTTIVKSRLLGGLALAASRRLVVKTFLLEKLLLAYCEDELSAAVPALKRLVL
jgi:hypothetical protein